MIAIDRGKRTAHTFTAAAVQSRTPLHTTHPVIGQVWRSQTRQARLATFLKAITVHPLDDGRLVGQLLARSRTSDVVDAHLVATAARLGQDILTGDPHHLLRLTAALGATAPVVHSWP
ncbi:MAG: hypothetical protein KDB86_13710 [Actinobacteria bacterium]|nr:hypothetical protein [Actinomycetota bacterium]MCB9389379.1 hypothetical protein [Acidimicrobiia bacterium]